MPPSPRPKNIPPRRDPPKRKAFFGYDPTKLQNPDPRKRYKFVDPSARMEGVESHLSRGWEIESRHAEGPVLARGNESKMAEPITLEGLVLMSISREEAERIDREGQYGQGGQELLDEIDNQIANPRGGGYEGLHGGEIADVINETRPLQRDSASI